MFRFFCTLILILSQLYFFETFADNTSLKSFYLEGGVKYNYLNWNLNNYIKQNSSGVEYFPSNSKFFEDKSFHLGWHIELGKYFTKNIAAYLRVSNNNIKYTSKNLSLQDSLNNPLLFSQTSQNHIDPISSVPVKDLGLQNAFLYTNVAKNTINSSILYVLGGLKYNLVNLDYIKFFVGSNIGISIISVHSAIQYNFHHIFSKHKEKLVNWLNMDAKNTDPNSLFNYYQKNEIHLGEVQQKFFSAMLEDKNQENDKNHNIDTKIATRVQYMNDYLSFTHNFQKKISVAYGCELGTTFKILPGVEINLGLFTQWLGKYPFKIEPSQKKEQPNIVEYIVKNNFSTKQQYFWTIGGNASLDLYF